MWNAIKNFLHYPSKWNPLYGEPKKASELGLVELLLLGVRNQKILPETVLAGTAPAAYDADVSNSAVMRNDASELVNGDFAYASQMAGHAHSFD